MHTGKPYARSGFAKETLITPIARHPGESRDPVTFAQRTNARADECMEMQSHWAPDIASRFRDDD
jgi:hypothetical protein